MNRGAAPGDLWAGASLHAVVASAEHRASAQLFTMLRPQDPAAIGVTTFVLDGFELGMCRLLHRDG